jgi:hypothetical protein
MTNPTSTIKNYNGNMDFSLKPNKVLGSIIDSSPRENVLGLLFEANIIDQNYKISSTAQLPSIDPFDSLAINEINQFLTTPKKFQIVIDVRARENVKYEIDHLDQNFKDKNKIAIANFLNSPLMKSTENLKIERLFFPDALFSALIAYPVGTQIKICGEFTQKILIPWLFSHLSKLKNEKGESIVPENLINELKENQQYDLKNPLRKRIILFFPGAKQSDLIDYNYGLSNYLTGLICKDPDSKQELKDLICTDGDQFLFYQMIVCQSLKITVEPNSLNNFVMTSFGEFDILLTNILQNNLSLDALGIPLNALIDDVSEAKLKKSLKIYPEYEALETIWQAIINKGTNTLQAEKKEITSLAEMLSYTIQKCHWQGPLTTFQSLETLENFLKQPSLSLESKQMIDLMVFDFLCSIAQDRKASLQLAENTELFKFNWNELEEKAGQILRNRKENDTILHLLAYQVLLLCQIKQSPYQRLCAILEEFPRIFVYQKLTVREKLFWQMEKLCNEAEQEFTSDKIWDPLRFQALQIELNPSFFALAWIQAVQSNDLIFSKALDFWKELSAPQNHQENLLKEFKPLGIKQAFRVFNLFKENKAFDKVSLGEFVKEIIQKYKKQDNTQELSDQNLTMEILEPLAKMAVKLLEILKSQETEKKGKNKSKGSIGLLIQNELTWLIRLLYEQKSFKLANEILSETSSLKILTAKDEEYAALWILACESRLEKSERQDIEECIKIWKKLEEEKAWKETPEQQVLFFKLCERIAACNGLESDLDYFLNKISLENLDDILKKRLSKFVNQRALSFIGDKNSEGLESLLKKFVKILRDESTEKYNLELFSLNLKNKRFQPALKNLKSLLHLEGSSSFNKLSPLVRDLFEAGQDSSAEIHQLWFVPRFIQLFVSHRDEKVLLLLKSLKKGKKDIKLLEYLIEALDQKPPFKISKEIAKDLSDIFIQVVKNTSKEQENFTEMLSNGLNILMPVLRAYDFAQEICILFGELSFRELTNENTIKFIDEILWAHELFLSQKKIAVEILKKTNHTLLFLKNFSESLEKQIHIYDLYIYHLLTQNLNKEASPWIQEVWQLNEKKVNLDNKKLLVWAKILLEYDKNKIADQILIHLQQLIEDEDKEKYFSLRLKLASNYYAAFVSSNDPSQLLECSKILQLEKKNFLKFANITPYSLVRSVAQVYLKNNEIVEALKLLYTYDGFDFKLLQQLFKEAYQSYKKEVLDWLPQFFKDSLINENLLSKPEIYCELWIAMVKTFGRLKSPALNSFFEGLQLISERFVETKNYELLKKMIHELCLQIFSLEIGLESSSKVIQKAITPLNLPDSLQEEIELAQIEIFLQLGRLEGFLKACQFLDEMITNLKEENPYKCIIAAIFILKALPKLNENEMDRAITEIEKHFEFLIKIPVKFEKDPMGEFIKTWQMLFKLRSRLQNQKLPEQLQLLNATLKQEVIFKETHSQFFFQEAVRCFIPLLDDVDNSIFFMQYCYQIMDHLDNRTSLQVLLDNSSDLLISAQLSSSLKNLKNYYNNLNSYLSNIHDKKTEEEVNKFKLIFDFPSINTNLFSYFSIILKHIAVITKKKPNISTNTDDAIKGDEITAADIFTLRISDEIALLLVGFCNSNNAQELYELLLRFKLNKILRYHLNYQKYKNFMREFSLKAPIEFIDQDPERFFKIQMEGLRKPSNFKKLPLDHKKKIFKELIDQLLSIQKCDDVSLDENNSTLKIHHAIEIITLYDAEVGLKEEEFTEYFYKIFDLVSLKEYQSRIVFNYLLNEIKSSGTITLIHFFINRMISKINPKYEKAYEMINRVFSHLIKQNSDEFTGMAFNFLENLSKLDFCSERFTDFAPFVMKLIIKILIEYKGWELETASTKESTTKKSFKTYNIVNLLKDQNLSQENKAIRQTLLDRWIAGLLDLNQPHILQLALTSLYYSYPKDSTHLLSLYQKFAQAFVRNPSANVNFLQPNAIQNVQDALHKSFLFFMEKAKAHKDSLLIFSCFTQALLDVQRKNTNNNNYECLIYLMDFFRCSLRESYIKKEGEEYLKTCLELILSITKEMKGDVVIALVPKTTMVGELYLVLLELSRNNNIKNFINDLLDIMEKFLILLKNTEITYEFDKIFKNLENLTKDKLRFDEVRNKWDSMKPKKISKK